MKSRRCYLTPDIYVELPQDHTVVSWPGGHKVLDADSTLTDLLGLIHTAFTDTLAERPTARQVKATRAEVYDQGYRKGWEDAKKHMAGL